MIVYYSDGMLELYISDKVFMKQVLPVKVERILALSCIRHNFIVHCVKQQNQPSLNDFRIVKI